MARKSARPTTRRSGHVLGSLSAKYETSGRGPGTVSTGRGDAGGVSYGSYQLASKLGRPEELTGTNLDRWSDAVRDAVWSTAVQNGPANDLVIRAMKEEPPHDRALLFALYAERGRRRADGSLAYFSRNSADVQAGVARRFRAELKDALAMLGVAGA